MQLVLYPGTYILLNTPHLPEAESFWQENYKFLNFATLLNVSRKKLRSKKHSSDKKRRNLLHY